MKAVEDEVMRVKEHKETRREKERNHDDIGYAAEGIFRRKYCRVCANLGRIYHGIREKESFVIICIRRL